MVLALERLLPTSKITFESQRKKLSITYNPQQIGKPASYITSFLERADVRNILPTSHPFLQVRLERKEIQSRNGDLHTYLVVHQGKMRFLFDMPDDPSIPQPISEMTLVVPKQTMQEKGLLPAENENGFHRFTNSSEYRRFRRAIEQEGYFAGRTSGVAAEQNEDFIQPIPALIVTDTPHRRRSQDSKLLLSVRNTAPDASIDPRMEGLAVFPFAMGHSNPSDFGKRIPLLSHNKYREIAEETAYTTDPTNPTNSFHAFREKDGKPDVSLLGILRLRRYYRIRPFGLVYVENKGEIEKVHAGILFIAEPKTKHVTFTLNGKSHESLSPVWKSADEYSAAVANGTYNPAGWNEPILQQGIIPYFSSRRKS